jgi:acetyl esterase
MSRRQLVRARRIPVPHGPGVDRIFGGLGAGVTTTDHPVVARDGAVIRVRRYQPRSATSGRPLIVYCHGGGWVIGSLGLAESICSRLAAALDAVVVSVDYRLAPENRFPAALHDTVDAVGWAVEHALSWGADADRLGLAGDSAGANLVAATVLAEPTVKASALGMIYPTLDLTLASPSMRTNADAPMLTRAHMRAYRDHYLGPAGDPEDPLASPLFAPTLATMPPTLIQTAGFDPLHDDGARFAERLREEEVPVVWTDYPNATHGFTTFPGLFPEAEDAFAELVAHLRTRLA